MYEQFYGLAERPFDLTPNPRFLLLTALHREALSLVAYGIAAGKGIMVLLGEAGTGKTTVLRAASKEAKDCLFIHIDNPRLEPAEFLELLAVHFELAPSAAKSKARFLVELRRLLQARHEERKPSVLVIDEAQCLSDDLLEEVRLLANMETDSAKLLPVVLAGQPEFGARLDASSLRQLKQRVALRCLLKPLELQDTAAYIAGRLRVAGGEAGKVFTGEAARAIHEASGGIPRVINVICDNALTTGYATNLRPVNRAIVLEVCRDLEIRPGVPDKAGYLLPRDASAPYSPPSSAPGPIFGSKPEDGRRSWFRGLFASAGVGIKSV
jgi:general secretion pathway protein A